MAIPLFVKVTPFVAMKMRLDAVRFRTADGNFLLRQSDFLVFGPLRRLPEYVANVGGVILRDAEAAANMHGELNTPLPAAADPEWAPVDEEASGGEEGSEADGRPEPGAEPDGEGQEGPEGPDGPEGGEGAGSGADSDSGLSGEEVGDE